MNAPATTARPRLTWRSAVAALLVTALLAACAASDEPPSSEPGVSPPDASPTEDAPPAADEPPADEPPAGVSADVPTLPTEVDPSVMPMVDAAVADLATRLDVAPDAVEVLAAHQVTWPDSALGCPQEGMTYAQVLTEGVAIELSVEGTRYRYHAGSDGQDPFPCDEPADPAELE